MARVRFSGVTTAGIKPAFLSKVQAAANAVGATEVVITSGRRAPGPGNDVQNSNHISGDALDGYAVINGTRTPIGQALLPVASRYGLRSGDVAGFDPKTQGGYDPIHVDDGYNVGGAAPAAAAAPSGSWPEGPALAYASAEKQGLTPAQAKDFAAAQYGESSFNPNAVNKTSGAAGLYQLLSPGYVNRANQLGGVLNPRANIEAILPSYARYYKTHPQLVPGAAGANVEASGQPASFYAQGYQHLPGASPVAAALAPPGLQTIGQPAPAAPAPAKSGMPAAVQAALRILSS